MEITITLSKSCVDKLGVIASLDGFENAEELLRFLAKDKVRENEERIEEVKRTEPATYKQISYFSYLYEQHKEKYQERAFTSSMDLNRLKSKDVTKEQMRHMIAFMVNVNDGVFDKFNEDQVAYVDLFFNDVPEKIIVLEEL